MPEQTPMTPDEHNKALDKLILAAYGAESVRTARSRVIDAYRTLHDAYQVLYREVGSLHVERTASQPLTGALASYLENPESLHRPADVRGDSRWRIGDEPGLSAEEVPLP